MPLFRVGRWVRGWDVLAIPPTAMRCEKRVYPYPGGKVGLFSTPRVSEETNAPIYACCKVFIPPSHPQQRKYRAVRELPLGGIEKGSHLQSHLPPLAGSDRTLPIDAGPPAPPADKKNPWPSGQAKGRTSNVADTHHP